EKRIEIGRLIDADARDGHLRQGSFHTRHARQGRRPGNGYRPEKCSAIHGRLLSLRERFVTARSVKGALRSGKQKAARPREQRPYPSPVAIPLAIARVPSGFISISAI